MTSDTRRLDHDAIDRVVEPGARVLDLGCGDGELLLRLARKGVRVQGIECSVEAIHECVGKGLSVLHGDIEGGLVEYPDQSFDYVILNQSLQEIRRVDSEIEEALRIGRKVIVGFPNFAYWPARFMLFFRGRAPMTESLPNRWHDTPNLRFLSITDFREFCAEKGFRVLEAQYLGATRKIRLWPNLLAMNAIFVLAKQGNSLA